MIFPKNPRCRWSTTSEGTPMPTINMLLTSCPGRRGKFFSRQHKAYRVETDRKMEENKSPPLSPHSAACPFPKDDCAARPGHKRRPGAAALAIGECLFSSALATPLQSVSDRLAVCWPRSARSYLGGRREPQSFTARRRQDCAIAVRTKLRVRHRASSDAPFQPATENAS